MFDVKTGSTSFIDKLTVCRKSKKYENRYDCNFAAFCDAGKTNKSKMFLTFYVQTLGDNHQIENCKIGVARKLNIFSLLFASNVGTQHLEYYAEKTLCHYAF